MSKSKVRVIHCAKHIRGDGAVSALCFRGPRPIDMERATWTTRREAVTCARCLRKLEKTPSAARKDGGG